MVRFVPIKATSARDEHLLLVQQVERELLVVRNVELLDVELGEDIERRLGLDRRHAVDRVQRLVHIIALLAHAPARRDVTLDALVAAECGLHDGLRRHVGTQAHVGEHVHALDEVAHAALVAREHHPANAVAGDHVALGQARERHARQVGCQARDGDVLVPIHDQAIIDLIGEDHELVPARDLDDALQDLLGVQRARGVVGVDDDDCLGALGYLGLHVVQIGVPLVLLVADVVNGRTAGKRGAGRPQRIIRAGNQYLVACVQKRVQGELDELGHTVAGEDGVHIQVGDVLQLRILHDRLARREEPLGVGVALALGELLAHVEHDLVGRAEAEGRRVADVQLKDALALRLHAVGLIEHGATYIVEDVLELG